MKYPVGSTQAKVEQIRAQIKHQVEHPTTSGMQDLHTEFEKLFPPFREEWFKYRKMNVEQLVEKYCYKVGCPMCGGGMVPRSKKGAGYTSFHGCGNFPKCTGIRDLTQKIIVSNNLREWLLAREETTKNSPTVDPNGGRWAGLDED